MDCGACKVSVWICVEQERAESSIHYGVCSRRKRYALEGEDLSRSVSKSVSQFVCVCVCVHRINAKGFSCVSELAKMSVSPSESTSVQQVGAAVDENGTEWTGI